MHKNTLSLLILMCCVCSLLTGTCNAWAADAQQQLTTADQIPLAAVLDDTCPGAIRIGDIQILYGRLTIHCPAPENVCFGKITYTSPFVEVPVVTFANITHYQSQNTATVSYVPQRSNYLGFTARVAMQANISTLKTIPWTAIGRWR